MENMWYDTGIPVLLGNQVGNPPDFFAQSCSIRLHSASLAASVSRLLLGECQLAARRPG